MTFLNEVDLEYFLMEELGGLGNELMHGAQLAPETTLALRANYHDTILEPKFSSWSLMSANFGRCFHVLSIR